MDLEKLYNDYFSVVYKYILSVSHDSLTAEEITQETFFKAGYFSQGSYDDQGGNGKWKE